MQIVYWFAYGSNGEDCVVFAPRERADYVAQIHAALQDSDTCVEFKQKLPEGEWDGYFQAVFDEPPDGDQAFEADDVPGHADGDYPPWLAQEQLGWFPPELISKYDGEVAMTVFNGSSLNLPAVRTQEICDDLRALAHNVVQTDPVE